jgi:hypothetical protein
VCVSRAAIGDNHLEGDGPAVNVGVVPPGVGSGRTDPSC